MHPATELTCHALISCPQHCKVPLAVRTIECIIKTLLRPLRYGIVPSQWRINESRDTVAYVLKVMQH